ncbi:MAG: Trans-aconitate 2-methyltransferase [Acidobacteria bacterium OLB17]|nr:MAG: Trans-aconitate 2-methyltransferase [Acidobacteria bacterium OLB17]MCZ2390697.1 class I SAM-dependent methyltransferase [Acidobacteriota bacterium]
MPKSEKELAYLADLYVQAEWTRRFTELVDKHIDLTETENLAYLNAGTGEHAISLGEKFGKTTDVFASCENAEVLLIARDKAAALRSAVDFSQIRFEDDSFDAVFADASFAFGEEAAEVAEEAIRIARVGADVAFFLPSAGSFGEIFSLLWEVLETEDLGPNGPNVEELITQFPSTAELKRLAESLGLVNVRRETVNEIFEYENGEEFVTSPFVADFLLPRWLAPLDEDEQKRVVDALAKLIDDEDGSMAFRFSVKATLVTGEKG